MAKEPKKTEAKGAKAEAPEFKYGVSDLAKALDIQPTSVRVALRSNGVKKAGKSYGWNTKAELEDVIAQIKPKKEEAAPKSKKAA